MYSLRKGKNIFAERLEINSKKGNEPSFFCNFATS